MAVVTTQSEVTSVTIKLSMTEACLLHDLLGITDAHSLMDLDSLFTGLAATLRAHGPVGRVPATFSNLDGGAIYTILSN